MRKLAFFFLLTLPFNQLLAQDLNYVRKTVRDLTSPAFHGRGYVRHGDKKAARYIHKEYKKHNLKSFQKNYYQPFIISINTFPKKLILSTNGTKLTPGIDYIIACNSPPAKGVFPVYRLPDILNDYPRPQSLKQGVDFSGSFIIVDDSLGFLKKQNPFPSAGIIVLKNDKLWWHVSGCSQIEEYVSIDVLKEKMPVDVDQINLKIKNKFYEKYQTQNVIGYVKGIIQPDTFVVFTAHYDHLGRMGPETFFPGAHDNASGTAMLMDLARYYTQPENQPYYSIVFMAFSAEEAGLKGSKYYTEHPLFPLENIRFLVNLDMVSSGSDGIMVVNGKVLEKEFLILTKINEEEHLLKNIKKRPEAKNSDHYYFYEKGVPSFFIYTLGDEYTEYHTIDDEAEGLPFTEYDDLFTLLTKFVEALQKH